MKFAFSAVALVACAAAAPIVNLSGKVPDDKLVTKIVDISESTEPGANWLRRRFFNTAGAGSNNDRATTKRIVDLSATRPGNDWATKKRIVDLSATGTGDDWATKRIVDLSASGPGDDWLTKRQGGTAAQQNGGVTGNLNGILQASSLGGASGSIIQGGDLGAALLSGTGNLANLPATTLGGTTGTGTTAQGAALSGAVPAGISSTTTTSGTGAIVSNLAGTLASVAPGASAAPQKQ
ncbi:uncharacterized protein PV09_06969 [Verruconis gallopava]|uniref:Uncharacterized protein n=1 Tax=Verruconis gallopava TaxID=253628 RepID=A0A0D2AQR0_9PEZI|nr:uncharacterized protein PV09_06969 [Verruconis gallopava]KIW01489.1 hypothetical protein PV09_06969 [Verruconis gallopava]